MTVLLSDDFDGTLAADGHPWATVSPALDWPNPDVVPYNGGGTLHFQLPAFDSIPRPESVSSNDTYPLRCTQWTWVLADVPTATITTSTAAFLLMTFGVRGRSGAFNWNLRYYPPDVDPTVGPSGADTAVVLLPSGAVESPPVADIIDGTPEVDFDISLHKYLRITEECHTVTWSYSADGSTWTDAYTYDLDAGFIYVDRFTGLNDWIDVISAEGALDVTYEVQVESALGESNDDCPCKQSGWHIGRVGAGGQF